MLPKIKLNNRIISFRLREDRATLLACIGFSLFFWILISMSKNYESSIGLNLNFKVNNGFVLKQNPPNPLSINFIGRGWDLLVLYLKYKSLNINLQVEDSKFFSENLILEVVSKQLEGLNLVPQKLNQNGFQAIVEKEFKKKISSLKLPQLTLTNGYTFKNTPYFTPDSIEISGPESLVKSISHWNFIENDLSDINNSTEIRIPISPFPPEIKISHKETKLIVEVEKLTEKSFFVPIKIRGNVNKSIQTFPEKVHFSCAVGVSRYNNLTPELIEIFIEIDSIENQDASLIRLQLGEIPFWLNNIRFSPENVRYFTLN